MSFGLLVYLGMLAAVVWVVWSVISCLRRISRGIEDMAETLRRIERRRDDQRLEEPKDGQLS